MIEHALRADLAQWLGDDSTLGARLNAVHEEGPVLSPAPTLAIVASAAADWSSKTSRGREVRLALELIDRSDRPAETAALLKRVEERIATLAPEQSGYRIVVTQFLRSRTERRPKALRAVLLEYRFRLLELHTE